MKTRSIISSVLFEKKRLQSWRSLMLGLGILTLTGCNGAKYAFSSPASSDPGSALSTSPTTTTPTCQGQLRQVTVPVKILFVVDASGSNSSSDQGFPASDPKKNLRAGSIEKFLNDYSSKTNFSWGLIAFNDDQVVSYVSNPSGSYFTSKASEMTQALKRFRSAQDTGDTPYELALSTAETALRTDVLHASQQDTEYVVVFLSDGRPEPFISINQAASDVQRISRIDAGRVSLSTLYYGVGDQTATQLMSQMASTGTGIFLDVNSSPNGKSFKIEDMINLPGTPCTP